MRCYYTDPIVLNHRQKILVLSKPTDQIARRQVWNQLMTLFPVFLIEWLVILEHLVPNVLLLYLI